ncbi:MAG: DoxX family membrane protein [Deltaproteobacteria bacterium]|nr:DoxX family membrane protein [Deltaproteobacteria bacterium]
MTKKRKEISRFFYLGVRLILGVIFIYAGYDKILHPKAFAEVVYNYQILPDGLINVTAIFLPWLEMLMGVFLMVGFWMPGTIIWCNILLVVYIGALWFNLARGLDVNCGCFSTTRGSSISIETILWDVAFLTLSVYLFFAVFGSRFSKGSK